MAAAVQDLKNTINRIKQGTVYGWKLNTSELYCFVFVLFSTQLFMNAAILGKVVQLMKE